MQLGFSSRGSWRGHAASREMRRFALRCEGRAAGGGETRKPVPPSSSRLKRTITRAAIIARDVVLPFARWVMAFPRTTRRGVGSHTSPPDVWDVRDMHPASRSNKTGTQACDRFASSRKGQKGAERPVMVGRVDKDALAACSRQTSLREFGARFRPRSCS